MEAANEQNNQSSTKRKGKKNAIKIDSSKLDNFDLLSAAPVNSSNEEYDVDLDALRAKLSQTSIEKPKKKKKVKKSEKSEKEQLVGSNEAVDTKGEQKEEEERPSTKQSSATDSSVITVKPMKKKTKKKAIIIE